MPSTLLCLLFIVGWAQLVAALAPVGSVPMTIDNFSGKSIHLYWVSFDKELVAQTNQPILNSSNTVINSYNSHRFRVLFDGEKDGGRGASFVKGPHEETISVYTDSKDSLQVVQYSKYDEFHSKVVEHHEKCGDPAKNKGYAKCLSRALYKDLEQEHSDHKMLKHYRDEISDSLRNYTCADPDLQSSPALSTSSVVIADKRYNVSSLLDMDSAKIWTVPDFVTADECAVLEGQGRGRLTRATVAGEDGLFTVSNSRRAQQASYRFSDPESKDPLWSLYQRIFQFTNLHTGYAMELPGQEGFTIIQYNSGDEYKPHCDGSCDGSAFQSRGRVATAVLYCRVPERGGGTSFTKANLFVKPKTGMATFFSYKGSDDIMDRGFTEHSGCPILEGEKWISTVWMRQGVSTQHDWQSVDPSGERVASPPLQRRLDQLQAQKQAIKRGRGEL